MTALAEKQGELWCQLLALFSQSRQNQLHRASKRHPTKVLSCMHLKMMSSKIKFQQYGWTVLGNTVTMATPAGGKVSVIYDFAMHTLQVQSPNLCCKILLGMLELG